MMKTLGADKVTRAALVMIALGIWSLFLLQLRGAVSSRTAAQYTDTVAVQEAAPPRFQMVRLNSTHMYLLDAKTGRTWSSTGREDSSVGNFCRIPMTNTIGDSETTETP